MGSNVWSALWKPRFNPGEFLYHYTTFETALKILYSDKFQFSPLSKTNDTTEQKTRINYAFPTDSNRKNDILSFENYWSGWAKNSKLLCFSLDRPVSSRAIQKNPFDISGRGFALPRMWAQYASKNSGVCLVIRKESFIEKVKQIYPEAICKEVSYYDWSQNYEISEELFKRTLDIIKHNPSTGYAITFLKNNPEFADYAFFCKLKDWEGEREYRILIPNCNEIHQNLYIEGVGGHLVGVVVGEHMDDSQIYALKTILSEKKTIPIRKIAFELSRCSIVNVSEI